ncbi:competence protein ComEC [Gordonia amarae]|uniref:Putative ComEC/Rec2-related protein n=1 Tax=Gordonia amarae NBRC 15530 TaxID=1075090 RepID=G7GJN4_9ACTN|nr:ComEC/Rec2 family competence protein [Gordonia amarae]MCS3879795.1 competence protein ComEC [Gordonia amarae]GAB03809.1 putative ComEC/Rec2-related protein [Gordonia amarae NBRC 15530]
MTSVRDLRLVVPAAAVWSTTIVGLLAPSAIRTVVIVCVAAGVGVSGAVGLRLLSWRSVGIAVLVLGMAATAGIALSFRVAVIHQFPLHDDRGKVTVTVRVVDDPVPLRPAASGRSRVRVDVVAIGERAVRAAGAHLVGSTSEWAQLVPGQRVRVLVRVRPPPDHTMLVASLTAVGTPTLVGAPPAHQRVAAHIRDRLRTVSARALGSPESGLLPGLVLGDISGLDDNVREDFRDAGLAHLTAVSGSNFAIVCGAVLALLALLGCPRRYLPILGLAVIVGFVILVRPSPSVLRAALMGAVGLFAMFSRRKAQALPSLGTAVIVGLLWWPELALAPGFALSVAATAGIVLWGPAIRDWLWDYRIPTGLAEVLAMAIAAQLVTAPIIALISGRFSIVAIVANILVVPVVAAISIVGTAAALVGSIGGPGGFCWIIAELLARILGPALWWMVTCAGVLGGWAWASIPVPDGVPGALLAAAATIVLAMGLRRRARIGTSARR